MIVIKLKCGDTRDDTTQNYPQWGHLNVTSMIQLLFTINAFTKYYALKVQKGVLLSVNIHVVLIKNIYSTILGMK